MKNKKGFTLIELLAVIVILAIIALIAVPIVLNMINSAKKKSAIASAYGYIDAIEYSNGLSEFDTNYSKYDDGEYEDLLAFRNLILKGERPANGVLTIAKSRITNASLCIKGYNVVYNGKEASIEGKCNGIVKRQAEIVLSKTSEFVEYPNSTEFEITKNTSDGEVTCESSDTEIATCTISNNKVTVQTGKKLGAATIKVITSETSKYIETAAAFVITTEGGLLSYTANNKSVDFDNNNHSLIVECEGAKITYSDDNINFKDELTFKDAGIYTVYFKIEKEGYNTITGNKTLTINKVDGSVTAPTAKTLTYTGSEQVIINAGNSTTGTIEYKLDNGTYSTTIPSATNAGTYKVYYKVIGDNNHNDVEESSINVTISKKTASVTLSSTSGSIDKNSNTTFTVSGANGTITCESSSTSIATCTVSGTKVTVNGISEGNATITVKVAASTNYLSTSKTYTITVNQAEDIEFVNGYKLIVDTNNNQVIDTGDEIQVGVERFYVISNKSGKITALAKMNIDTTTGRQSSNANTVVFANSNDWPSSPTHATIDIRLYDGPVKDALYGENGYEKYIKSIIPNATVRLIEKVELESLGCDFTMNVKYACSDQITWINEISYWTQSMYHNNKSVIWAITRSAIYPISSTNYTIGNSRGVRPVIEIPA